MHWRTWKQKQSNDTRIGENVVADEGPSNKITKGGKVDGYF